MRASWLGRLAVVLLTAACAPPETIIETSPEDAAEPDCIDRHAAFARGETLDAGAVEPSCEMLVASTRPGSICQQAVQATCGALGRCADTAACIVALLMADQGAENRCTDVVNDPGRYPLCDGDDACDALVRLTCGGGVHDFKSCLWSASCQQALREEQQSRQDLRVIHRCRQALEESSLYPRCDH